MALPATAVFEVRTTGSDSNAGMFDPSVASAGTDYSQQDTAQITYSDLVIGGTTTQLTSAGNPFTSAHVGNSIAISGGTGFTTGIYNIRSVSGSTATMDRSVGTGASTGGTGKLGGALASPGVAVASAIALNTIYCRLGPFPMSASTNVANGSLSFSVAGVKVIGYSVTRGDGGQATFQCSANSVTLVTTGNNVEVFENIFFDANSKTTSRGISSNVGNFVAYCKFSGFDNNAIAQTSFSGFIFASEFTGCSSNPCVATGSRISYCYFHDNTVSPISLSINAGSVVDFCVLANNSGASTIGITCSQVATVKNNTIYNCGQHGISVVTSGCLVADNLIYGNGGLGINANANLNSLYVNNAAGANTSGNYSSNILSLFSTNNLALTADPFNNKSGGDYSLNATAGGGASCRAAGVPGVFPGLASTTGYLSIGAVQERGGGGVKRIPQS